MQLTIAEIAKRLEVPESTIRSWRDRYAAFIPSVGQGRKKRYEPEALEVFAKIAELSAAYPSTAEVTEQLAAHVTKYHEHCETDSSNYSSTTAIDRAMINDPMYRVARVLEEQLKVSQDKAELVQRIEAIERRLTELEQRQPFWKRNRKTTPQDAE
jgi:DNA-binding transcriptional MerR regulator